MEWVARGDDEATRPNAQPTAAAAAQLIDEIEAAEEEWGFLLICKEVGLQPSAQSQLNPQRLARVRVGNRLFR